ncbi:MAG: hypothetical protein Q8Q31_02885 [Nanoarchaeota archaeon]|nr:hypothetical protein [Nanoarchaeota archaeon]
MNLIETLSAVEKFSAIFVPDFSTLDDPEGKWKFQGVLTNELDEEWKRWGYHGIIHPSVALTARHFGAPADNARCLLLHMACKRLGINPVFADFREKNLLYDLPAHKTTYDLLSMANIEGTFKKNTAEALEIVQQNFPQRKGGNLPYLSVAFKLEGRPESMALEEASKAIHQLRRLGYVIKDSHIDYRA